MTGGIVVVAGASFPSLEVARVLTGEEPVHGVNVESVRAGGVPELRPRLGRIARRRQLGLDRSTPA